MSGAFEALLYDGLEAAGAQDRFAPVYGAVTAAGLVSQLPAAVAATVLFAGGGYELVGWVSIGVSLAAALLATRLPERPREASEDEEAEKEGGFSEYLATLRAGFKEVALAPALRTAIIAAAALGGIDALDEYFGVMAQDWGVATAAIPIAILGIPLAGAAGAALGGAANRLAPITLALILGFSFALLAGTGVLGLPVGLAGVALFYALYRLVLVVVEARVQERIEGSARATVTSVAGLGVELGSMALFAAWAIGGLWMVSALGILISLLLPRWLHNR